MHRGADKGTPVKILLAHNKYQQPGGEDSVFANEAALLRRRGHEVFEYVEDNASLDEISALSAAARAIWSRRSRRKLVQLLTQNRPDIAHFHNTFFVISPSAYSACRRFGVPVVQTLHNYRLLCPAATFFRNGRVCEDCLPKTLPWPGVLHACYRGNSSQTALIATILTVHRFLRTWHKQVDLYIALTEFARRKFAEGGLPPEKIVVKPNFAEPAAVCSENRASYALFLGRLSHEKGVLTLLQAWQSLKDVPLVIAGDGPLLEQALPFVQSRKLEQVKILGWVKREEVMALVREAAFLVYPSEWYENFPVSIAEAFACGVPVIAARLGALTEIIEEGTTGLTFSPGNPHDLSEKVRWAHSHPAEMAQMGRRAREEFETKYAPERNYELLMAIYLSAMERRAVL
jgi:glycosyltransferase involved in cell wall biosynthesis